VLYRFQFVKSDLRTAFVICTMRRLNGIVEAVMAEFPLPRRKIRAPRVNLWGNVSATIQLENGRQVWAKTLRISITGGLLELATCLDEGVKVGLTVHLGARPVRGKAAMMFPMWAAQGYLQPFRFTDLREEECLALQTEVGELLKQAKPFAPGRTGLAFRPTNFLESS
jgi:hypothetical protein